MSPSFKFVLPPGLGGTTGAKFTLPIAFGIATALFTLYRLGLIVYRVFFHPLAKYPGPKLYAATNLAYTWKTHIAGTMARDSIALHKKYGPVVRIAPDGLAMDGSLAFPQAFQHRPGKPEWSKKRGFYHENDELSLIGGTNDVHRRLRRQLGHAFSDQSMYEQEPAINQYIQLLCFRLSEIAAKGEACDIVSWLNFTTFDIIGDLMFADSFHSLDNGDYHPWVLGTFDAFRGNATRRAILQYPFLKQIIQAIGGASKYLATDAEQKRMSVEKAMARKAMGEAPGGRRDFMTYMLRKGRNGEPGCSDVDILYNSPTLVVAGSETTATALSGLFFHLGLDKYRHVYKTLLEEIRGTFQDADQIDMKSTSRLPYLHAVIEETLRIYPPAVETPPRVSPGAEINGEFIPKGSTIVVYQNATYHNAANFVDPDSFRPERWLPASHPLHNPAFANDNHTAFKPFSFGTRDCIGKNLAYSELRTTAASILFRFDYELLPGQERWAEDGLVFGVWQRKDLMVKFTERKLVPEA